MKPGMVILSVLVALSLAFSIAAFAIVANSNGFFTPSNPSITPTPTATSPPVTSEPSSYIKITPSPSPYPTPARQPIQITINYNETARQNFTSEKTKVTLNVEATYQNGETTTIPYSQFYLRLTTARAGFTLNEGYSYTENTGVFTLGPGHTAESFQLTFEYPTTSFNGMDNAKTLYSLCYNGTALVIWENNSWH